MEHRLLLLAPPQVAAVAAVVNKITAVPLEVQVVVDQVVAVAVALVPEFLDKASPEVVVALKPTPLEILLATLLVVAAALVALDLAPTQLLLEVIAVVLEHLRLLLVFPCSLAAVAVLANATTELAQELEV
jgi:hypothetical protein